VVSLGSTNRYHCRSTPVAGLKKSANCANPMSGGLTQAGPLPRFSHRARSASRSKLSTEAVRGSGRSAG
jgi:hypothetical protein